MWPYQRDWICHWVDGSVQLYNPVLWKVILITALLNARKRTNGRSNAVALSASKAISWFFLHLELLQHRLGRVLVGQLALGARPHRKLGQVGVRQGHEALPELL
jgi:hypothetical protein